MNASPGGRQLAALLRDAALRNRIPCHYVRATFGTALLPARIPR